jgi:multicomponent Na+:H+ antiporter subunit D
MIGKSRGNLWGTVLFLAGGLGLAGLPPFGNFAAKVLVEHAADAAGYLWIPGALILGSALDGGAVIKAGLQVYFGFGEKPKQRESEGGQEAQEEDQEQKESGGQSDPPWTMTLPSVAALVICIILGVWHTPFDLWSDAAGFFTDQHSYYAAVMSGQVIEIRHVVTEPASLLSYGFEALTLVLLAIFVRIALRPPQALERAVRAPVEFLRRLHSGAFPDYMAYISAGAGLFALALFAVFGNKL